VLHAVDHGEELATIHDLNKRFALSVIADHVNGRRVLEADAGAKITIGRHFRGELALRIYHEWQINSVLGSEFFRKGTQVVFIDFQLVLEDVIAEFIAHLLGMRVEVAREHGGIEGPGVFRQREIVTHDGDVVGFGSLFEQGRGTGTIRTLEIHPWVA